MIAPSQIGMERQPARFGWNHVVALLVVLAVHGGVLYALSSVRMTPQPSETAPLFVTLIAPAPPQPKPRVIPPTPAPKPPAPPSAPKPVKREAPRPVEPPHHHLAAEAPVVSPTERTEPLPPSESAPAATEPGPPAPSQAAGPLTLTSDLAVVCPVRTPPPYPSVSRRLGESGKVVLRVELDETGRVSTAQVITSSGHKRLDDAALAAVKTWRCQPAQRDGQAVRSVAVQPFDFKLEGQ